MTPEEQNITIAEHCGWKQVNYCSWFPPDDMPMRDNLNCPDYAHDLNAMHEAERVLNGRTNI